MENELSFDEQIELAKIAVASAHAGKRLCERRWLSSCVDSYGCGSYRVVLYVLEGSPAKGYVIANYGTHQIFAFDGRGRRIKRAAILIAHAKR